CQTVKLTLDWQAPAYFDDVLDIEVYTSRTGNTSFVLEQAMTRVGEKTPLCRVEGIYVLVSLDKLEKTPIPDDLRETLQAGAAGVVIDQSGSNWPVGIG